MSDDDPTTDRAKRMTVDLTDDEETAEADSATETETGAADSATEPVTERQDADEVDIEAVGEREAQRLLDNVEGADNAAKLSNAKDQARQSYQAFEQQRGQTTERIEELEKRDSDLEETDKRVRSVPADALVLQTLAGGVTIEVTGDDGRERLLEDIAETREAIADQLDQLADRLDSLERGMAIAQAAHETLDEVDKHTQMLSESGPSMDDARTRVGADPTPDGGRQRPSRDPYDTQM